MKKQKIQMIKELAARVKPGLTKEQRQFIEDKKINLKTGAGIVITWRDSEQDQAMKRSIGEALDWLVINIKLNTSKKVNC